jgi:hypothetical protein
MDAIDKYNELNERIEEWADECISMLKAEVRKKEAVSNREYKSDADLKFIDSLYYKVNKKGDAIYSVGFAFKKHAIFVHYGLAGRGGTVHVAEKHWWTDVMNKQYDKMAIILAEYGATLAADKLSTQLNTHINSIEL